MTTMQKAVGRWGRVLAGMLALLLGGCALPGQSKDEVLIREPGHRRYAPPAPASAVADRIWSYAVLSANVYRGAWRDGPAVAPAPAASEAEAAAAEAADPTVKACVGDPSGFLPIDGWTSWPDFPSESLRAQARRLGLYLEVWENRMQSPPMVAVVFRGTEFRSWRDWQSNLRWFTRFVPLYEDQYTAVSRWLGAEFVEAGAARGLGAPGGAYGGVRIVSTGHSLGGGLAQHFAYSLPLRTAAGVATPRVAQVYAFDPSPVTGWFSVEADLRGANARDLVIDRIFEHGEVLAYLRLVQSYAMPPSAQAPAVREIRFNFRQADVLASHSMTRLACDLALARTLAPRAASTAAPPRLATRQ